MDDAVRLAVDDAAATIHPADGGRLGSIVVRNRAFLRPYEEREHAWGFWGSYPLIPWSNRIAGATFRWDGREWTMPDRWVDGTALHGLVCRRPWSVVDRGAADATIAIEIDTPPWTLTCSQHFALATTSLVQVITVRNAGEDSVPVGIGIHPWFPAGLLQVQADRIWPAVDCIPTGPPRPVSPTEDLRAPVVPPVMDECYTGLTASVARVGDVSLSWSGPVSQVVVYTGEPGWTCVEPVTNANDGFNLLDRGVDGHGVVVLAAGESTSVTYTFAWDTKSAPRPATGSA